MSFCVISCFICSVWKSSFHSNPSTLTSSHFSHLIYHLISPRLTPSNLTYPVWSHISCMKLSYISWRYMPDSKMETSSLKIPPVWKHDEHITTLWVNRGPPSFTHELSIFLSLPHTLVLPLSLSQTCGYSYIWCVCDSELCLLSSFHQTTTTTPHINPS